MKKLTGADVSDPTLQALKGYQNEIDNLSSFTEKAARAKAIWPARKQNRPFDEVKEKLVQMCHGPRRCGYCEDSFADEIGHIWPKNYYPEKTFVWENYLYACGPCNGPKNDKFSIFTGIERTRTDLTKNSVNQNGPPAGDPLLINPREENPIDTLFLDITNTFNFAPFDDDPQSEAYIRADYTIDILTLNSRADLVTARRNAYGNYKARLTEYIFQKQQSTTQDSLNRLIDGIKTEAHPTVWEEMKRQHTQITELNQLFQLAPEARNW